MIIDRWIKTRDGWVSVVDFFADIGCAIFDITQIPNSNCKRYMNVNVLHELLGHPSKATTRLVSKKWM